MKRRESFKGPDTPSRFNQDSVGGNDEDKDEGRKKELKVVEQENTCNKPEGKTQAENKEAKKKKTALKKIIVLAIILGFILAFTTNIVRPLVIRPLLPSPADEQYFLRYMQVAEVLIISYFAIELVAGLAYNLVVDSSEQTAKSMKSLVRIAGSIIVIAFVISFLSQNPVIAASISTVSGLVIGFGASNIIGNALGGIYLAIVRPFRIGERIKVFNEIGIVYDIGLLYTQLILENGDRMLASNSSMLNSQIILKKKSKGEDEEKRQQQYIKQESQKNYATAIADISEKIE